ncbi:porin [Chitinibacter sp. FCG-7]|uniref:Porin n=1 Tax=Chitinibacter mangrovi TaxID=3153927 RepID=A0AAU7F6H8_9NEIS
MFKRAIMVAAVAAAVSAPAFAEVSISGSAEMDLFYLTGPKTFNQEIAIVLNFNGSDKLDTGDTLKWKVAQKVATDYRYDSFGNREAWIGYAGSWGELRFGNQFSNTYLMMDWPYGTKGAGNLFADTVISVGGQYASYFSPNFGGFSFAAQYDMGTGSKDGTAYDLTASFASGDLNLDAAYYATQDATQAQNAANGKGNSIKFVNGQDNAMWMVGGRYNFGSFGVKAAYKGTEMKNGASKTSQDQYLVSANTSVDKSTFTLTYSQILDSEKNGKDVNDGVKQLAFQWDYSLSKNTGAFLQARYQDFDSALNPAIGWGFDGRQAGKDNSARVLIGTWTGF